MARRDGEPRIWPYVLVFALLCAGAVWGRKVEVAQRNSARAAAESRTVEWESLLATTTAEVRACLAAGRCDGEGVGFFALGTADPASVADDRWMAGMGEAFWPQFGGYLSATLDWNATLREALDDDLVVTDAAAVQRLADVEAIRLQEMLSDARAAADDDHDRGRLLSRVFGWGWNTCLAMLFLLPVVAAFYEGRRLDRIAYARWRESTDGRESKLSTAAPTTADGEDSAQHMSSRAARASVDGTPGTTSTPLGPSSTNVS